MSSIQHFVNNLFIDKTSDHTTSTLRARYHVICSSFPGQLLYFEPQMRYVYMELSNMQRKWTQFTEAIFVNVSLNKYQHIIAFSGVHSVLMGNNRDYNKCKPNSSFNDTNLNGCHFTPYHDVHFKAVSSAPAFCCARASYKHPSSQSKIATLLSRQHYGLHREDNKLVHSRHHCNYEWLYKEPFVTKI